jgi:hypothetical protein
MAHYIDFNNGAATFPLWEAAGDFEITFRIVFGDENNEIILGQTNNTRDFIAKLGSTFSVKLANSKTDTDITVNSAQEVIGSVVRVSGAVTVTVNGDTFSFTQAGAVTFDAAMFNQSINPSNGDFYYVTLDNGTDLREYESDGVGLPDNDPVNPQDATLSGTYSFVEYSGGNSISVGEADRDNFVFQRDNTNNAVISFPVSYGGTPTSLEYRLLDARDDATEIQGWQVFDSGPTGGESTLAFSRAASLTPIHVEVRHGNDTSISFLQTLDWWVGDNILIFGQSLANFFSGSFSIPSAPSGYFQFDGTDSVVPTSGAGALALAQEIIDSSGCAVCILNAAESGSNLMGQWLNENANPYQNMINDLSAMTGGDNKIAFAWWHQGTADSKNEIPAATYQGGLGTLFGRVRAIFSGFSGTLDILVAHFGRYVSNADCTDESHQAIRKGQVDYIASDENCYGVNFYPRELGDGVHGTKESYQYLAGEIATVYYGIKGDVPLSPLTISSASYNDTDKKIYISYNDNLNTLDTAYSTEGVRILSNGSPLTITSYNRVSENQAEIVYTGSVSGGVTIETSYGRGVTANELTYPRKAPITLPSGNSYSLTSLAEISRNVVTSSSLTLNIGAPDGTYHLYLTQGNQGNVTKVYDGSATFSGGSTTITGLAVAAGVLLRGFVDSANTADPSTGDGVKGVTV